jgi:DnaD/phage-associated family protein
VEKLLSMPQDAVALSAATVDALVSRGSGDAALLYLYLLRHGGYYQREEALKALQWESLRLDSALLHLQELGLVSQSLPSPATVAEPARSQEGAPEYSSADITEALEQPETEFSQLLHLVEGSLGRKLNVRELKLLYELLDYLEMPPDVILTLVQWQISCAEQKLGPGRRPSMTTIRAKAYYWKQLGIDTIDSADAFLKKQELQKSRMGELMAACQIVGRAPTDGEQKHLSQWIEWNFPAETVAYAYDITVTNTGKLTWNYCTKVLRNWHEKGLHTLAEVQTEKQTLRRRKTKTAMAPAPAPIQPAPQPTPEEAARQAEAEEREMAWLQQMLQKMPPKRQPGQGEGTEPS